MQRALWNKMSPTLCPLETASGESGDERNSGIQSTSPGSGRLSFEEIYRTFFDRVHRWTRALGGPPAEREDLVQDVFLVVHRRLPDFDGQNVDGWLYQITRRRVRDFRRRHWMRLFLSSRSAGESLVSSSLGPDRQLESKEQEAFLFRLLSKLPETQRAAFVLFDIDGFSGEEVARLEGVKINTVWARVKTAREKLATHIARLERAAVTIPVESARHLQTRDASANRVGACKGFKSFLP